MNNNYPIYTYIVYNQIGNYVPQREEPRIIRAAHPRAAAEEYARLRGQGISPNIIVSLLPIKYHEYRLTPVTEYKLEKI